MANMLVFCVFNVDIIQIYYTLDANNAGVKPRKPANKPLLSCCFSVDIVSLKTKKTCKYHKAERWKNAPWNMYQIETSITIIYLNSIGVVSSPSERSSVYSSISLFEPIPSRESFSFFNVMPFVRRIPIEGIFDCNLGDENAST